VQTRQIDEENVHGKQSNKSSSSSSNNRKSSEKTKEKINSSRSTPPTRSRSITMNCAYLSQLSLFEINHLLRSALLLLPLLLLLLLRLSFSLCSFREH